MLNLNAFLETLFVKYWSQITLILLGIGYLIKRILDRKSKKLEINHTAFQQQKISVISNFLEGYSKTEWMFNELSFSKVVSHEYSPEQIDKIIFPPLNELRKATLEIELYFDEDIYQHFKVILSEFYKLNSSIMQAWGDYSLERILLQKSNHLESSHLSAVREAEKNLKIIAEKIKAIYKS